MTKVYNDLKESEKRCRDSWEKEGPLATEEEIRLFLEVFVGKEQIDEYMKNDFYIEFPVRSLLSALPEYHRTMKIRDIPT